MKKIFITTASAILFSLSVFAADGGKKVTVTTDGVSYLVQQEFAADFANAKNVTWTVTKNVQKADFIEDGAKKTAFYNMAGDFLGTTQTVDSRAIPAKAKQQIADKYKGYTTGEVIVFQTSQTVNEDIDATAYFVDLKSSDHEVLVRITPNGNTEFFKQVK